MTELDRATTVAGHDAGPDERRRDPRRPARWPAALRDGFAIPVAMGFTENVSNGGVRLVCKDPGSLPTDEALSVKISLLDGKGAVVGEEKHPCRIAYVQKRQDGKLALGIQFLPDPDEA